MIRRRVVVDVWEHARAATPDLTGGLVRLELRFAPDGPGERAPARMEAVLADGWHWVIARARENAVDLLGDFLPQLHRAIAAPLGIERAGELSQDISLPWDAVANDLLSFTSEDYPIWTSDAWLVSELVWGGHIEGLGISTGWLLVNGLRLQAGERAMYPVPELDERFLQDLRWAGPDLYDAENLRALFSRYDAIADGPLPHADGGDAGGSR